MQPLTFNAPSGLNYTLRQANFFETKGHFTAILGLAKNALKFNGDTADIDIGQLIANIGTAEFSGVENFILAYASVFDNEGKEQLLKSRSTAESHFNANRGDYIPLIIEGLKYHFLEFLPDTLKSSTSIAGLIGAK
ncbi:putative phage tail assembly chaperone [Campylobacter sp. 9BO]|uniref:putative phage tail assembly chaperone n=1 Tax=Campylobacter sp. 9BO TaxID=3424759 RepID=UPI003D3463E4